MVGATDPLLDLFVVHSDADAAWVDGYLLPALGLPPQRVATSQRLPLGLPKVSAFDDLLAQSRITVLVLTPALLDEAWTTFGEQLASHTAVEHQRVRLVPLLLEPCELPLHVEFRVRLNFVEEAAWDREVGRLRDLLNEPVAEPGSETEPIRCPYPGMASFSVEDVALFFGRQREIAELWRRVRHQHVLFLIGPSGSGKSSLVRAGLIPELSRKEPGGWVVRSLRPGNEPVRALEAALDVGPRAIGHQIDGQSQVQELLSRDGTARRVLLVIDQVEEVFTQAEEEQRHQFFAAVERLAEVSQCVTVLAIRADFYPELMASELWPAVPGQRLEVVPLRGGELRSAIEEPAAAVSVRLQPALVERLLADAAGRPGVLPLLQETLVLLWANRRQRLLTLSAYEALGHGESSGLAVALATTADAAVATLDQEHRAIARRILLRLVQMGDGREDTRRQQPVTALRAVADNQQAFDRTLQHLVDRRLLTIDGGQKPGDAKVDLSHEAMISGWPMLRTWLGEGRAAELARRRIESDANDWEQRGRDRASLYRGRRLRDARDWQANYPHELSGPSSAFLAAGWRLAHVGVVLRALAATLVGVLALAGMRYVGTQLNHYQWRRAAIAAGPTVKFAAGPALLGTTGVSSRETLRSRLVSAFSIDRHEVTYRQYRLCVRVGECSRPFDPPSSTDFDHASPDLPVVFVTAAQAFAFCRWLGGRLPTAVEWERAVRGSNGLRWPWGQDAPTPSRANLDFGILGRTAPVDDERFAEGTTVEGVAGLVGNVWEWIGTPSECWEAPNTPYECRHSWDGRTNVGPLAIYGGAFNVPASDITSITDPTGSEATVPRPDVGFRCAQ